MRIHVDYMMSCNAANDGGSFSATAGAGVIPLAGSGGVDPEILPSSERPLDGLGTFSL